MKKRTAFICGGSSGLGLATAQLLVESGEFAQVWLSSRSAERGAAAVQRIVAATSAPPDLLEALVLDCCDPASIVAVSDGLAARGARIDLLLLSAGQIYPSFGTTSQGIENTVAASLAGQHALTVRLLRAVALAPNARILIAGAEGARGDIKMAVPYDLRALAQGGFEGDLERAIRALCAGEIPRRYSMILRMVTTKLLAVHWAKALAPMLPRGTTVNVVSPGTVLDTGAMRHAPAAMRAFFHLGGKYLMKLGGDQRPAVAAAKYLQAAAFDGSVNGTFWASPPGKAIGELTRQTHAQFDDPDLARATWNALVSLTGEGLTGPAAGRLA